MRSRIDVLVSLLAAALVVFFAVPANAAPEAHILRIDPRVATTGGTPILTTVVELGQHKRLSDVTADCGSLTGMARADCVGQRVAQPGALFQAFDFPDKSHAIFTVLVDGADQPAQFVDKYRWDQAQNIAGVGTAWLIVLDGAGSMGNEFGQAQAVAQAFVNSLGPQDIANVVVIGTGSTPVKDSHWVTAAQKGDLLTFISQAPHGQREGRARPLMTAIRNAATDAFKDLGNAGAAVPTPLHQAMVVLSNGDGGADTLTNGAGATQLSQYLSKGRFPEDNDQLPKTPLPVVSVLFPTTAIVQELTNNASEFMTNLANPDIGGYFAIVKGNGGAMGPAIVGAVRDRYNKMWVVRWKVSCIAPTVLQSFNLVFKDVNPPIAGDGSFKNVPVGIDPTTWPLDIDVAYTQQNAKSHPVTPGGEVTIYGNFCWGTSKDRAQIYFIPQGTSPPAQVSMNDIAAAKRAQQQLIAMKMDGQTIKVTDTTATFKAPDNEKIIIGKGEPAVARVVVYDAGARRMSGVTANTILTLKAAESAIPITWILAGAFAGVVIILLLVAIARGGGGGRGRRAAPAPLPPPGPGGPGGWQPGGPPPGGNAPPPQNYAAPPAYAPAPAPAPAPAAPAYGQGPAGTAIAAPPPGAPAASPASPDFLYGGKPPQYGLTTGQPVAQPPPPDPYAQGGGYAAPAGGASRATLSGAAGTFTVLPGAEMRAGRDAAQCQIVFQEPRVSGVHASVKLENGQLWVRDERSNNGTHVNGARIAPGVWTPVPTGSMLRFGPVELSVRLE